MKSTGALLLVLSILWGFACPALADAPFRVTATIYPLYVAAMNIAKGLPNVAVTCLAPPQGGCQHDVQLTTKDRRILQDSDLILRNGAGLDNYLDPLLPALSAQVAEASRGIALLECHEGHGRHEGHDHGGGNPHVWMDPKGMIAQVENIAIAMMEADPQNGGVYRVNADAYVAKLQALNEEMAAALAPYEGMPFIAFHEAFDPLFVAFGLHPVTALDEEEANAPTPRALARAIDAIRGHGGTALFGEMGMESPALAILARDTGAKVYGLYPITDAPQGLDVLDAYLIMMENNLNTLLEAMP